jgi:hypothetical protein
MQGCPQLAQGQASVVTRHVLVPEHGQACRPQPGDAALEQQGVLEAATRQRHLAAAALAGRPTGAVAPAGPGRAAASD